MKSLAVWSMDEVSFSSRHNSIVKSLISLPGLQYILLWLLSYYILVYDISLWMFGNVSRKQYLANIILICLHVPLVVLEDLDYGSLECTLKEEMTRKERRE